MAIVHRLALAALVLACASHSPVGAIPPGRAGGGLAAIFTRNVASSSSSSTASTQPTSSSSSTASTGTNAQPSNRKKDSVPYLQQYLRDWVKTEVPVADNEGHLYLNPPSATGDSIVGREAANKREKVPYNSIKNRSLRKFYSSHIYTIPDPVDRAVAQKNDTTAIWDYDAMARAAREFEIPANTQVLMVHPEWLCHDICSLEKDWRTPSSGVRIPCPHCKCNKWVRNMGWTVQEAGDPRGVVTDDERMRVIVVGPKYKCVNKNCGGTTGITSKDARWNTFTGVGWNSLPDSVKKEYDDYITRVDDGGSTLASPSVADLLLDDKVNFKSVAANFEERYRRFETKCIGSYARFVDWQRKRAAKASTTMALHGVASTAGMSTEEKEKRAKEVKNRQWPTLNVPAIRRIFQPPGEKALISFFDKAFALVEPHLLQHYYSQRCGRIMRSDVTFEFAGRTMDNPDSDVETNGVLIVHGEYGNVIGAHFVESESKENLQRAMYIYRNRAKTLWGDEAVKEIVAGYTDTCCEGCKDPTDHWFPRMWPSAKRAPHKDLVHGIMAVTDPPSTHGGGHVLNRPFCRGIRDIILEPDEERLELCAKHYISENKGPHVREVVLDLVRNDPKYKSCVPNSIRGSSDKNVEKEMMDLLATIQQKDSEMADDFAKRKEPYDLYVKEDGPFGRPVGTARQMENFLSHHRKGCFDDPLPKEEMYYEVAPAPNTKSTKPLEVRKLRGTNGLERGNRSLNETAKHVSRQKSDRGRQRLLLRVSKHNLAVEKKVEHLPGKPKARPRDWYIREALQQQYGSNFSAPIFEQDEVLPKIPEGYYEPFGPEFLTYKMNDQQEQQLQEMLDGVIASVEGDGDSEEELFEDAATGEEAAAPSVGDCPPQLYEYGGETWSKGGKRTARSFEAFQYSGVPANGNLNQEQRYWMNTAIGMARFVSPKKTDGPEFFDLVANQWNKIHDAESSNRLGGIGGYIRSSHVKAYIANESQTNIGMAVGVQPSPSFVSSMPSFVPPVPVQQPCVQHYPTMPHGAPLPHGYSMEYKKQAPIKKETNLPPTDIEGWDDISKVRNHSWRERARILKYHGLTQFGKEDDQIARLEEHLRKTGTATKGTKRRK